MWMGYVAVARNVGIWLSRQRISGFGWVRITNSTTLVFGGLVVLMAPWIAASVLEIFGGWLGGIRTFLHVSGIVMNSIAGFIGFGAFLTTRAGRKPEYWTEDLFTEPTPRRRRSARGGFDASGFEARTARGAEATPSEAAPAAEEAPAEEPAAEADPADVAEESAPEAPAEGSSEDDVDEEDKSDA